MEKCKMENSFESSSGQQSQLITQLEFQKWFVLCRRG